MLKRYFSLAIPVMLSAVAVLAYVHFRQAAAQAEAPQQLAQAPVDPFAPDVKPADPAKPADPFAPEVKPADPLQPADPARPADPGAKKRNGKKATKRKTPENDDEVETPFLRNLLTQMDGMTEGTDEDKKAVRQMIYDADVELSDALGPNMRRRIEAVNRKKSIFVVAPGPRRAVGPTIKRKDVLPAEPKGTTPVPDAKPGVIPEPDPNAIPERKPLDELIPEIKPDAQP